MSSFDRGFLEVVRAKTRDYRNVALSANLVAWLKPLVRDSGPVFEGHSRRWRDRVMKAIATEEEAEPLAQWPQDVLRHTYLEANNIWLHRNRQCFTNCRHLVCPSIARF